MIAMLNRNLLNFGNRRDIQNTNGQQQLEKLLGSSQEAVDTIGQYDEQAGQDAANSGRQTQANMDQLQAQQEQAGQQAIAQQQAEEKAKKAMLLKIGIMAATGGFGGGGEVAGEAAGEAAGADAAANAGALADATGETLHAATGNSLHIAGGAAGSSALQSNWRNPFVRSKSAGIRIGR